MLRHLTVAGLLCGLLAGCSARADLPPIDGKTGSMLEPDERRIWNRSAEEQRNLDRSGLLYDDAALEAYLNGVMKKLQPAEVYSVIPLQVKVLRNSYLNAYCLANGAIYVHAGILARMENEAQLAALLAHEAVHATHRHEVKERRKTRKTVQINTVILAAFNMTLGEEGIMAAIAGHSREHEREADAESLRLMARAGYDPREAKKIFEILKEDIEEDKEEVPFFFNTHPRVTERIESCESLLNTEFRDVAEGARNEAVFRKHVRGLILDTVELDLKRGRFRPAERNLLTYLKDGDAEARAYFLWGELYRQRGGAGDGDKALENYRQALARDARFAEAYRALGLLLYKRGEKQEARRNLRTYLTLAPQAPDRQYLEEYLREGK